MDDIWLEDECLTVLRQSSVLEFALPPSNHLNLEGSHSPITLHDECAKSVGDSASSAVSMNLKDEASPLIGPSKQSTEVVMGQNASKDKNAAGNINEVPETEDKETVKKERVRSWSGSPDWDFKEGCSYSYSVQSAGLADEVSFLTSTMSLDSQEERVLFPRMKPSVTGSLIRKVAVANKAPKIRCDNNLRVEEDHAVMDSARDVKWRHFLDDSHWDVAFPSAASSFCNPSDFDKSESIASSCKASGIRENDNTCISLRNCHANHLGLGSLLSRVKNEVDIELLEDEDEEDRGEIDMESLGDGISSYSDGSDDDDQDQEDHHSKSTTFSQIINVVVGIGACAMFQIMK